MIAKPVYNYFLLTWKQVPVKPRDDLQRIFIVDFSKDLVVQPHSIHAPKSVVLFMIWKILISSFQNPEIGRIFGRHPTVFTKQDTVLIFYEKLSGIYRLPS